MPATRSTNHLPTAQHTMDYNDFGYDFTASGNNSNHGGSSNSHANYNDLQSSQSLSNSKIVDRMIDYLTRDNADLKARNKILEDRLEVYSSRIDTLTSKIEELNKDNLALSLTNSNLQAKVDLRTIITK